MCNGNTTAEAVKTAEPHAAVADHGGSEDVVLLPLHMFWLKKIEKVPKATLYAYLFKPNPPNSAK